MALTVAYGARMLGALLLLLSVRTVVQAVTVEELEARLNSLERWLQPVSTYKGDGSAATNAALGFVQSASGNIVQDASSNKYIIDAANHRIIKITSAGAASVFAGGPTAAGFTNMGFADGIGTAARFNFPKALAVDGTYLYVADTNNHRIRRIRLTTQEVTTIVGDGTATSSGNGGPAIAARVNAPAGVAYDPKVNALYIAESHRVRVVRLATMIINAFVGTGVQGFAGDGAAAGAAQLRSPSGMFVALTGSGTTDLYISDSGNHVVRKVPISAAGSAGNINTIAGIGGSPGYTGDGFTATAARLRNPNGLFVANGELWIADTGNYVVRRVTFSSGRITTAVGSGVTWETNGEGVPARLVTFNPSGVFVESSSSARTFTLFITHMEYGTPGVGIKRVVIPWQGALDTVLPDRAD